MKEISYKELRNLPFGTKVRVVPTPSGKFESYDGMVCNGLLLYEYGDTSDLKLLEMYEDSKLKNPNNHITKYYVVEDENTYEKMWKELKKKVVNDRDYYGNSRSVYSCSDYDERKHRMSTLNDVMAIMSSIEKSHE